MLGHWSLAQEHKCKRTIRACHIHCYDWNKDGKLWEARRGCDELDLGEPGSREPWS